MSWFNDAIETIRSPVRDAYAAVESTATSLLPAVGEWGRNASSWFYEEFVAMHELGLTPEQAWVVFVATTVVGVGTGGGSLVAGMLVRTAAKAALKQAVKRGAIAAGITAVIGWAAFTPLGGGGGGGGPPGDPGTPTPAPLESVPVEPPDRKVELVVVPDGYLSNGVLLSRNAFASWCLEELAKPGNITVDLRVDDNDPEHLIAFARESLERENARREARGMVPAKIRFTEE